MNRYHCKIYFPEGGAASLRNFTARNNALPWKYSVHCLDNIKYRAIDSRALLEFIKGQVLSAESVFEYYAGGGRIVKACYRLPWSASVDVILVIGEGREIITVYLNTAGDNHVTLNANLYAQN